MKFNIKKEKKDWAFNLFKNSSSNLFYFGEGEFAMRKENVKNECHCVKRDVYDYQGCLNALRGEIGKDQKFTVKRFTVIQMK